MSLRLTVLLGPRETVEAAELKMGALPHTLAMAVLLDSWHEVSSPGVLPGTLAKIAEMFAAGIRRGEHLAEPEGEAAEPPPDQPASPAPVVHASAETNTTVAQKNAVLEQVMRVPAAADDRDPLHPSAILLRKVMRELVGADDFAAWLRVEEARDTARRIVALVERRAA